MINTALPYFFPGRPTAVLEAWTHESAMKVFRPTFSLHFVEPCWIFFPEVGLVGGLYEADIYFFQ